MDHVGRAVAAAERSEHRRRLRNAPATLKPVCSDEAPASAATACELPVDPIVRTASRGGHGLARHDRLTPPRRGV
jgi:hypothetical protein